MRHKINIWRIEQSLTFFAHNSTLCYKALMRNVNFHINNYYFCVWPPTTATSTFWVRTNIAMQCCSFKCFQAWLQEKVLFLISLSNSHILNKCVELMSPTLWPLLWHGAYNLRLGHSLLISHFPTASVGATTVHFKFNSAHNFEAAQQQQTPIFACVHLWPFQAFGPTNQLDCINLFYPFWSPPWHFLSHGPWQVSKLK